LQQGAGSTALEIAEACTILQWTQAAIVAVVPPGIANSSHIEVSLGAQTVRAAIAFQPDYPCLTNTSFRGRIRTIALPTFWEQSALGFWVGALFGLIAVSIATAIVCFSRRRTAAQVAGLVPKREARKSRARAVQISPSGEIALDSSSVTKQIAAGSATGTNRLLSVRDDAVEKLTAEIGILAASSRPTRAISAPKHKKSSHRAKSGKISGVKGARGADAPVKAATGLQTSELRAMMADEAHHGDELAEFIRLRGLTG
jgi:hypothetical protein